MENRGYELRIALNDSNPAIWREFIVPGIITLDRLHDVIQIVMGWTDSHLHEFTIGKKKYTEFPDAPEHGLPCGKYHLIDLIKQKGRTFTYLYDFGDSWEHTITIKESKLSLATFESPVFCLQGEGACPPEDVGGVYGYQEFLKVISDPEHEDYKNFSSWIEHHPAIRDGIYDLYFFDISKTNYELAKYLRWSRDRDVPYNYLNDFRSPISF